METKKIRASNQFLFFLLHQMYFIVFWGIIISARAIQGLYRTAGPALHFQLLCTWATIPHVPISLKVKPSPEIGSQLHYSSLVYMLWCLHVFWWIEGSWCSILSLDHLQRKRGHAHFCHFSPTCHWLGHWCWSFNVIHHKCLVFYYLLFISKLPAWCGHNFAFHLPVI